MSRQTNKANFILFNDKQVCFNGYIKCCTGKLELPRDSTLSSSMLCALGRDKCRPLDGGEASVADEPSAFSEPAMHRLKQKVLQKKWL